MKRVFVLMIVSLAACRASAPAVAPSSTTFDPVAFFTGRSHGDAMLDQMFKPRRRVTVDSRGKVSADGTLRLDQHIVTEGEAPRDRLWILRPTSPGHWAGSLTDAVGPVDTAMESGAFHVRYAMKGGLKVEQWLVPIPGRAALDNNLSVYKFGLRVADLHEVIVRR